MSDSLWSAVAEREPVVDESAPLSDNFGRNITYMRLSVTDHCNLRCVYCMPAEGIPHVPRDELLSLREAERLVRLSVALGITKVRITGGEPFVRKGLMEFLWRLGSIEGLEEVHITTNGVLLANRVAELAALGVAGINLSMDTLLRERFARITRRDMLDRVWKTFYQILEHGIPLKVNMVVQEGFNTDEIVPLALLARENECDVRFIEKMPFDGGRRTRESDWNHERILEVLRSAFPTLTKTDDGPGSTALHYAVPGWSGTLGIIAGFSRLFCGTCNRLRITARGQLKTCLYDRGVFDLRSVLRSARSDKDIQDILRRCVGRRFRDGFEAERNTAAGFTYAESMSAIGG